MKSSSL